MTTKSFRQAKTKLIPYTGDNFGAHLGASTIAGVASAVSSTPVDVVKTRYSLKELMQNMKEFLLMAFLIDMNMQADEPSRRQEGLQWHV